MTTPTTREAVGAKKIQGAEPYTDMPERAAHVPCNGCTACCRNDAIILHPECGDDPDAYETTPCVHPFTGKPARMIAKKPGSTDCIYLGEGGCTIHGRAPAICREFDCGKMWAKWPRAERRRLVRSGAMSAAVFDAGRRVQKLRGLA